MRQLMPRIFSLLQQFFFFHIRCHLKLSVDPLDLVYQGIISGPAGIFFCLPVPAVPGADKAFVDGRFRFLAGLDRILIIHKSSDIKSFPLESDGSTVFSIPQLIDATESAGIITAVLSFFQHLHTGSIYHMQLPGSSFHISCLRQPQLL